MAFPPFALTLALLAGSALSRKKLRASVKTSSKSHAIHAANGPKRLIQEGEDPFLGSIRAMKELDQHSTNDCSMKYGQQMLENFRSTEETFCSSNSSFSAPRSEVTCHQRIPFDTPRYMCELTHVEISSNGSRLEGCHLLNQSVGIPLGHSESIVLRGLESQDTPLSCSSSVENNALIQIAWETNNFYEWLGDWVTLWETLVVLEWQPKDVEFFLLRAQNVSEGTWQFKRPFDEAWFQVFDDKGVRVGNFEQLFGNGTCFANAVIVPDGSLSTITFNGGRGGSVNCASPSVMASALYLEALFSPSPTTMLEALPESGKQVTLLLRRGVRSFDNDASAEEAVRRVLPDGWCLKIYRPEDNVTLSEQLAVAAETQVLVSTHGAGLAHLMFLPPKARVVEIFCNDRGNDNRHYANLETMSDDAAVEAPEQFHLEAGEGFSSCKMPSHLVRKAIDEYDSSRPGAK